MNAEITQITRLKKNLSPEQQQQFDALYATQRKDPNTALVLSLLFGGFGVDRFYIGAPKAVLKLCPLGGLGIWALIDLFKIRSIAREHNNEAMKQIHDNIIEMRS